MSVLVSVHSRFFVVALLAMFVSIDVSRLARWSSAATLPTVLWIGTVLECRLVRSIHHCLYNSNAAVAVVRARVVRIRAVRTLLRTSSWTFSRKMVVFDTLLGPLPPPSRLLLVSPSLLAYLPLPPTIWT